ncbi:unnamed protein product [Heligmosomoides polygyrus]|uniref:FA_desaturase domain-containing protein n=1 Tax=Heligmosomoides polygyrus TaxID=6339 RepID=A0A183FUL8_HELPZ|nr:unnamed protein product [Heligmosomoides polygyrus]
MWPWPTAFIFMTFDIVAAMIGDDYVLPKHKSNCFSCASFAYLPLWNQLMHHYFPPKNFTDRCWQPDAGNRFQSIYRLVEDQLKKMNTVNTRHAFKRF